MVGQKGGKGNTDTEWATVSSVVPSGESSGVCFGINQLNIKRNIYSLASTPTLVKGNLTDPPLHFRMTHKYLQTSQVGALKPSEFKTKTQAGIERY